MFTIRLSFEANDVQPVALQGIQGGLTLLEVCLDNGITLRHDCGGVCHCTTCCIFVERGGENLEEASRRERDFLKRVPLAGAGLRLACQSVLLDGEGEIRLRVPERST